MSGGRPTGPGRLTASGTAGAAPPGPAITGASRGEGARRVRERLVAGARSTVNVVTPGEPTVATVAALTKDQADAWGVYRTVPECTTLVRGEANMLSQVRYYPAEEQWAGGKFVTLPLRNADGTPLKGWTEAEVANVEDAASRIVDQHGSQAGLIYSTVQCWSVVGGVKVVAYKVDADGKPIEGDAEVDNITVFERWVALAPTSVTYAEGSALPNGLKPVKLQLKRNESTVVKQEVVIHEMWMYDPQFPDEPMGWVMATLDVFRDLRAFTMAQRSAARSGIPADLFLVPLEASPKKPQTPAFGDDRAITDAISAADEWAGEVEEMLGEFILGVMDDVDSGNSAVPGVLAVEARFIENFQTRSFNRNVDRGLGELVNQAISRISTAADGEPETLRGQGQTNRWNGKGIAEDAYRRFHKPKIDAIGSCWTSEILHVDLFERAQEGVLPMEKVRRVRLVADASAIVTPPDYSKVVPGLVDRGVVGPSGARRLLDLPEWAKPTPAEVEEMKAWKAAGRGGGDGAAPSKVPDQGDKGPPSDVSDVNDDRGRAGGVEPAAADRVVAAAGSDSLGLLLLAVEQGARARLEEAAEAGLDRAIERGANRLRNLATRRGGDPALKRMFAAGVPVTTLPAESLRAALDTGEFDDDDAAREDLFLAALAALLLAFRRIAADAYSAALVAVGAEVPAGADLPPAEIEAAITRGEDVLRASMLLLAERELFGPPGAPALDGEMTDLRVPTQVLRRALAVAGGALGVGADLGPDAEAALGLVWGPLIARVTPPSTGLRWVYGASARRQPFPEHEALDGEVFAGPTDDRLSGSVFSHTSFWHPGDHNGCRCDWMKLYER